MAEPIQPTDRPATTASTEVLPASTVVMEQPAPKKKRHPLRTVIILVVVALVLVAGFFVADALAKQFAVGYVRDRIVEVLRLDPKTPVEVDLGRGSILLQALAGRINQVDVSVPELKFGELSGSAMITATQVPLDGARPLGTLGIVMTIPQDNVRKLAKFLSSSQLKQIDVGNGVIRIGSEFTILFFTVPVSVDLEPSAKDGGISFDPKTVILGGNEISVADLRANPEFRALAGDLLNSQQVCVASYLPRDLLIDDVRVVHSDLVVSINGDGTALGGPGLSTNGTCPPAK